MTGKSGISLSDFQQLTGAQPLLPKRGAMARECAPALIMPARRIRENGRRKVPSCLPPRGQFAATFLVQTKKSRHRAIYHRCQEYVQQCRHHWRPPTRQRPIAHVFARQSPPPRFMHPSSIGRVQNNTPVTNFITAPFEDQMATPRNDARRVALLLNQPLNIGDRIFFLPTTGE